MCVYFTEAQRRHTNKTCRTVEILTIQKWLWEEHPWHLMCNITWPLKAVWLYYYSSWQYLNSIHIGRILWFGSWISLVRHIFQKLSPATIEWNLQKALETSRRGRSLLGHNLLDILETNVLPSILLFGSGNMSSFVHLTSFYYIISCCWSKRNSKGMRNKNQCKPKENSCPCKAGMFSIMS